MADLTFRPEIEVLSAADGVRRRHWSDADKLRIVEESFVGHRQASATARRHGISRSLLTTWRRQFRNGELGAMRTPMFTPLAVSATPPTSASMTFPASSLDNRVEIVLGNGRRLVVAVDVDPQALARLLPVIDGR
ncbi:transposase [Sulfitobacter sp. D35]|uniref:IS66-like element accessory protein TnpA n=1 Tax=Sulfitobacter sp. D35 TaxID=3083252 RepID=UPI00296E7710|nr:transposase [Sulfitobacter sp. D35]MDW4496351.1 transposase [Sulfitobacter sp. D35]